MMSELFKQLLKLSEQIKSSMQSTRRVRKHLTGEGSGIA